MSFYVGVDYLIILYQGNIEIMYLAGPLRQFFYRGGGCGARTNEKKIYLAGPLRHFFHRCCGAVELKEEGG
jgi:hypothetical protein